MNADSTVAYIGFASNYPFWASLGEAIQSFSDESFHIVDLTAAEPSPEIQAHLIQYAVSKKIDGIILGAVQPDLLAESLDKADELHIPVIALDTEIKHTAVKSFIATDNYSAAQKIGNYIAENSKPGYVLILGGSFNHPNGDMRRNGVQEQVEKSGYKVIFEYADWDESKAFQIVNKYFAGRDDISAVFSCWDPGIDAAYFALKQKNYAKMPILAGFDGVRDTVVHVKSGEIDATVGQNVKDMAHTAVSTMKKILNNEIFESETLIEGILITKLNAGEYLDR